MRTAGFSTVTVAVSLTSPALLRAVSLYVVVSSGLTCDAPDCGFTLPNVVISTSSALTTCHVSVELAPDLIVLGVAVNFWMMIFGVSRVVTVTRASEANPKLSFTVNRKLYVWPSTAEKVVLAAFDADKLTDGPATWLHWNVIGSPSGSNDAEPSSVIVPAGAPI